MSKSADVAIHPPDDADDLSLEAPFSDSPAGSNHQS